MSNQNLFDALHELGIIATQGEMQTVIDAVAKDGGPHVTICKGCGRLSTAPNIKPPAIGCCPDANYVPLQEWIDGHFHKPANWSAPLNLPPVKKAKLKKVKCEHCKGQGYKALKLGIMDCPMCDGRGFHMVNNPTKTKA